MNTKAVTPDYWIHRTEHGIFELRQTRFRAQWDYDLHPHDVCAVAHTREIMQSMITTIGGSVDWGFHLDPRSDDFVFTRRAFGNCWLHKTCPVWIVEYEASIAAQQPLHWQVYVSEDKESRTPWSASNRRLGSLEFGYPTPTRALDAACAYINQKGQ